MSLDEISRVAYNSGETFITSRSRRTRDRKLVARGGKLFEALLNAATSKYIYYGKAVDLRVA